MRNAVVVTFCLSIAAPVFGDTGSLDQLLESVRQQRQSLSVAELPDRGAAGLLAAAQEELAALTAQNVRLNAQFDANALELEQLSAAINAETGESSELFGVVGQYAGDVASMLKNSLVSAQIDGRLDSLSEITKPGNIPSPEQLHAFHLLMLNEMAESGRVARFAADVVDAAGVLANAGVVRVGTFNLVSQDKFLRYEIDNGTIQELARQPARRYRRDAKSLFDSGGGVTAMAIDPTGGQLLRLLIQTPDIKARVKQGGAVGWVIIGLGALGLSIGLFRLFYLGATGRRIDKQLKSTTPDQHNALGRILSVYGNNTAVDTETLELKLDEAIIRETPRLEKWQGALKVIAAVAPLLGLLGTVIGMIETFQQITLFGTSDPRLMADGISKALVTTMLGLLVAIPVVLLHSLVASRSKQLIEILEEQSAAIIAKQAEKGP